MDKTCIFDVTYKVVIFLSHLYILPICVLSAKQLCNVQISKPFNNPTAHEMEKKTHTRKTVLSMHFSLLLLQL